MTLCLDMLQGGESGLLAFSSPKIEDSPSVINTARSIIETCPEGGPDTQYLTKPRLFPQDM